MAYDVVEHERELCVLQSRSPIEGRKRLKTA